LGRDSLLAGFHAPGKLGSVEDVSRNATTNSRCGTHNDLIVGHIE
jgi:hypothetical protein